LNVPTIVVHAFVSGGRLLRSDLIWDCSFSASFSKLCLSAVNRLTDLLAHARTHNYFHQQPEYIRGTGKTGMHQDSLVASARWAFSRDVLKKWLKIEVVFGSRFVRMKKNR
jgi:hypothetical protein